MNVYRIVAAGAVRFVRAHNTAHARVRAYKVWNLRGADICNVGTHAPDIGERGYNEWVGTSDYVKSSDPAVAPQRKVQTVSRAQAEKVNTQALAMLRTLGLA